MVEKSEQALEQKLSEMKIQRAMMEKKDLESEIPIAHKNSYYYNAQTKFFTKVKEMYATFVKD